MIGTKIGVYEISAKLGEGGMGEVWRAKDVHLGRDVALKVLPEGFATDPERLARFEREAKLLAQLNHPNIAQIYGFEASGDTRALVMELVAGPTLAERLGEGPFPFHESLSVAVQIAHALEEAHEKGIVHRDLKPQNIKASREGRVKVLDFGLAKAMDPVGTASGATATELAKSPTLTLGATVQGMILGTAAYMAPEQARGLPVDKRADIWAFGVVLYEMLASRRLFEGELVSDVLAGVLRQEVDWSALPESTPGPIRALLRRCLERNPKNRLHDIADARIVLEEVVAGKGEEIPSALSSAPASVATSERSSKSRLLLVATGLAALAVGIAVGVFGVGSSRESPVAEMRFPLGLPAGWRLGDADTPLVAISRDGRSRAVAASHADGRRGLLVGEIGSVDWRVLDLGDGARAPFFSPDGRWIAYFDADELRRVSIDGGPSLPVTRAGNQVRGGVWTDSDEIVFSPESAGALMRVAASGGEPRPVTKLDASRRERTHRWPALLPGGRVLFAVDDEGSTEFYDDATIEAVALDTGKRTVLVRGSSRAAFLAPDILLYARGGALFAQRLDLGSLAMVGLPVPALQNLSTTTSSGAAHFDAGLDGALLWVPGSSPVQGAAPVWIERGGRRSPPLVEAEGFMQVALAPDGKRVVLTRSEGDRVDLWMLDLASGARTRLTFEGDVTDPTWTPDGRRVAYTRTEGGDTAAGAIWWKPSDGSGAPEQLISGEGTEFANSFSADARWLAFERMPPGGAATENWIADLKLGTERRVTELGTPSSSSNEASTKSSESRMPFAYFHAEISPDGRWLAYGSIESGRPEIYVRPFPDGGGKWQISTSGGVEPHWSPRGDELFYRSVGMVYSVRISKAGTFSAGRPEAFADGFRSGDNPRSYSIAPDGERVIALPAWEVEQVSAQVNLAIGWNRWVGRLLAEKR